METEATVARVTIVDIDMPFGSMVRFLLKWTLAAIPAFIIIFGVSVILGGLLSAIIRAM